MLYDVQIFLLFKNISTLVATNIAYMFNHTIFLKMQYIGDWVLFFAVPSQAEMMLLSQFPNSAAPNSSINLAPRDSINKF